MHSSMQPFLEGADRHQKSLEVIAIVAREVQTSLDIDSISRAAVCALSANFPTLWVFAHRADAVHQRFELLHLAPFLSGSQAVRTLRQVPYQSPFLLARAAQRRHPLVIENLQTDAQQAGIDSAHPLLTSGGRGYVCVPLWYADRLEGTLSAVFSVPLAATGPEVQTLLGCGTHLAAALAHARLHAEVEHDRARLRTILDQLPEGVLLTQAVTGVITYANRQAAQILGRSLTELVGQSFQGQIQPADLQHWNGRPIFPWNYALIRAFCGETVSGLETSVIRPDGNPVFLLGSSAPLWAATGEVSEAVLVFQDITQQISLEQQKNAFMSAVGHELRTPVTVIQGYAELLLQHARQGQDLTGPMSLRATSMMVTQTTQLSHLIEEMLTLSRSEQRDLPITRTSADLIAILRTVVEVMASTSTRHHLRLTLEGKQESEPLPGWLDAARIRQVLSNLVSNAIKYSPAGGEVEVGLRWTPELPEEALLWVRDQGIGIASEEIPAIFGQYYRARSLDPSISGLGIGLSLARDLITRHGGRIWVESHEGSGSTFFVWLPLGQPHQGEQSRQ